ncbi:hypothetical protein [Bradyrhizobium liaoningense]|nr:hypothetical protein [Bradyrhizobium liaoningense]MBR0715034.1 hypothetical protein [Bradyrhizobium liaoningense]
MFGLFKTMMNLETFQRLRRKVAQFWHWHVMPSHALRPVPIPVRPKRRKG